MIYPDRLIFFFCLYDHARALKKIHDSVSYIYSLLMIIFCFNIFLNHPPIASTLQGRTEGYKFEQYLSPSSWLHSLPS